MRRGSSGINALVAIDKPLGMTSHDVVSRVRRAVGERRVGHAGTLDPDASGVLVVGIGQGTRLMGLLTAERKSYEGLVVLGLETATDDAEGEVTREAPCPDWALDEARVSDCIGGLVGEVDQVPPAYSAISVNGVRSYDRARAGESFELPARRVSILDARLLGIERAGDRIAWRCSFSVSKGCYIRAIARDLGRGIGSAAHLGGLRRTSSGRVGIASCVPLEELEQGGAEVLSTCALDPAAALGLPVRLVDEAEANAVANGRPIPLGMLFPCHADGSGAVASASLSAQGNLVSVVRGDCLLGVWQVRGERLACSTNFPGGVGGVRR